MTNAEADALIATLPQPGGLRLYREGDTIVMAGGKTGQHSIAVGPSSGARLLVHWQGYVESNGETLGPGYSSTPTPSAKRRRTAKTRRPPAPRYTRFRQDRPADRYIILKPQSTGRASDQTFRSEAAARKEAARLDAAMRSPTRRHAVIPVWKEKR